MQSGLLQLGIACAKWTSIGFAVQAGLCRVVQAATAPHREEHMFLSVEAGCPARPAAKHCCWPLAGAGQAQGPPARAARALQHRARAARVRHSSRSSCQGQQQAAAPGEAPCTLGSGILLQFWAGPDSSEQQRQAARPLIADKRSPHLCPAPPTSVNSTDVDASEMPLGAIACGGHALQGTRPDLVPGMALLAGIWHPAHGAG